MNSIIEQSEIEWHRKNLEQIIHPLEKIKKSEIVRYTNNLNKNRFPKEFIFYFMNQFAKRNFKILDYGCGDGVNSILLYKCLNPSKVFGFDLSPDLVKIAKKRVLLNNLQRNIIITQGNGTVTDYKDDTFDIIFVNKVLHHMDVKNGIKEIHRTIKNKGLLVVCEPINDSRLFTFIRKLIPFQKKVTPYEKQFKTNELCSYFKDYFNEVSIHYFLILSRISKIITNKFISNGLYFLDSVLLKIFPFLRTFSSTVCIIAKNKKLKS